METKELVCVNCPKGCRITVTIENSEVSDMKGYGCDNGRNYAKQESIRPMRVLTTTVRIEGGTHRVLPVMSETEIPLDLWQKAMEEIRKITVYAPVKCNDVIVKDFLHTGVSLIACRDMENA